jgi:hypothetical protein
LSADQRPVIDESLPPLKLFNVALTVDRQQRRRAFHQNWWLPGDTGSEDGEMASDIGGLSKAGIYRVEYRVERPDRTEFNREL